MSLPTAPGALHHSSHLRAGLMLLDLADDRDASRAAGVRLRPPLRRPNAVHLEERGRCSSSDRLKIGLRLHDHLKRVGDLERERASGHRDFLSEAPEVGRPIEDVAL